MSGGASSLLALPAPGLTLADKQGIGKALLRSGANITEMNCVRKHLSAIKGGRLAVATKARMVSLIISDVPGDDLSVIGSGPTVPDRTTSEDALAILEKYRIEAPAAVLAHLRDTSSETPKPNDPQFDQVENILIAAPQQSLEAAAQVAHEAGYTPLILSDAIEGEARDVALVHAAIAIQAARRGQPAQAPCVLLSGGETTVTVRGKGRGGRTAEFLLALDVAQDNAGALLDPTSLARAEQLGVIAKRYLADNDGYSFFSRLDDLVKTGPTLTNVNDFRAILVQPSSGS
jgi:hydroxypyruvate reductase